MPEAVYAPERRGFRGEEISPLGKYREEEAVGDAMAAEGSNICPSEGQALDEGNNSLGQREPLPGVVGGGQGVGEPVPQPSNNMGGVEELFF